MFLKVMPCMYVHSNINTTKNQHSISRKKIDQLLLTLFVSKLLCKKITFELLHCLMLLQMDFLQGYQATLWTMNLTTSTNSNASQGYRTNEGGGFSSILFGFFRKHRILRDLNRRRVQKSHNSKLFLFYTLMLYNYFSL